MVLPLHGVSSAVSCSGTLDQGSLFRFEFIKITLLSLLFELSSCVRLTCAMLLVWDVARHGISTPFLKMFFSFQILVLSYEPFISLPFFSHCQGDEASHEGHPKSHGTIIFCLSILSDLHTSRLWTPWTLSRLRDLKQHRLGLLNTWQGEVCMVAPPLLDVHGPFFHFQLDSHWILQRVMIFKSWPIPHKLCIVDYQGWSSLLHLFKLNR